jgi:hypothetical protein
LTVPFITLTWRRGGTGARGSAAAGITGWAVADAHADTAAAKAATRRIFMGLFRLGAARIRQRVAQRVAATDWHRRNGSMPAQAPAGAGCLNQSGGTIEIDDELADHVTSRIDHMCCLRQGKERGIAETGLNADMTAHGAARLTLVFVRPLVLDRTVVVRDVDAGRGNLMAAAMHCGVGSDLRSERHAGMGQRRAEHQRGDGDQKNAHCGNHSCTLSE